MKINLGNSNRHISNNVRLVFGLIDYSELISDDSFILFLDFYKGFDTVEHPFIIIVLKDLVLEHTFVMQ